MTGILPKKPLLTKYFSAVLILLATAACVLSCKKDPGRPIAESMAIEATRRDFPFLSKGEVALDLKIKNTGQSVLLVDLRSDEARAHPDSDVLYRPKDILDDCLSFNVVGIETPLAKEERTSDQRRHRNELEEGGSFKAIKNLIALPPGYMLVAEAILWNESPDIVLGAAAREIEIRFGAPMLMVPPEGISIEEDWLVGLIVQDEESWLSKEYIPVSLVGRFIVE